MNEARSIAVSHISTRNIDAEISMPTTETCNLRGTGNGELITYPKASDPEEAEQCKKDGQ
jgi:hypothetical protein